MTALSAVFNSADLATGLDALAGALQDNTLTAPEILALSAQALGIQGRDAVLRTAGDLAEEAHPGAYHNTTHFREVIASCTTLMLHLPQALSTHQAFLVLVAAAIHDFHHDGVGNKLGDVHTPYRLEDIAFKGAAPALLRAGLSDEDGLDLWALLRATDVSGPAPSPARTLQNGGPLAPGLERFENRPDLRVMASILQAADIMTSAALDVDSSRETSARIEAENGIPANAASFDWFAANIALGALASVPQIGPQLAARLESIRLKISG